MSWGTAGTRRWAVFALARRVRVLTFESRIASLGAFLARVVGVRRRAMRDAQRRLSSCILVDAGL